MSMTQAARWQKSSFSGGGDGNTCVELATSGSAIHLRESDAPTTELTTTSATLSNLIHTLKAVGEGWTPPTGADGAATANSAPRSSMYSA
ncbi:DUF397 domain-containing protein [Streptomyces sp. NPDC046465]|uniref:DUF397 domain-containing protein n=1 Tax=Streptomyces sp. NPDC046465 TaxID=3155810 RepID=UPI0033ED4F4F